MSPQSIDTGTPTAVEDFDATASAQSPEFSVETAAADVLVLPDACVAYRIESGWLVLHTQEVRDLLACLRAIDDPSDQVALVAALRSRAYGCSDVDLLGWIDDGHRFN